MLFRPDAAAKTWDAWVYYHDAVYYLYYLTSERFPGDGFGVATSPDGVNWRDHGRVLAPSDQMVRYLGSGSVWQDPLFAQTGRFFCNYSEWRKEGDKNVQRILFAWSDDLLHWNKFDDRFAFQIDERFYQRINQDARGPWEDPRWDGICVVPRPEGGHYGYWTATPKDFLGFGFGMSTDGLHWEALEPPRIEWGDTPRMVFIEVGGVHEIGGQYYAMLADYATVNCGMFNFVSATPDGPFRPSARNYSLLRNQSKMHAYFTRFVDAPDGPLVVHHTLAEGQFSDDHFVVYYAPLKKALVVDGTLYLAWWQGNDRLKNREVKLAPAEQIRYEAGNGMVLEGELNLPGGLMVHSGGGAGTGILVNEQGIVQVGPIKADWTGLTCRERVDREMAFGGSPRFRLLLHRTMIEFYLNDIFVQCYTMETVPHGTISYQNAGNLKLWQWK